MSASALVVRKNPAAGRNSNCHPAVDSEWVMGGFQLPIYEAGSRVLAQMRSARDGLLGDVATVTLPDS